MSRLSTLERAFQLAPTTEGLDALRAQLRSEGYGDAVAQTSFPLVQRQLKSLMRGEALAPKKPRPRARTKTSKLGLSFANL